MLDRTSTMAALTAAAITASTSLSYASDFADMRGTWSGTYPVAYPVASTGGEPAVQNVEWILRIDQQSDNVFWGQSKWRVMGDVDWNVDETTGSLSLADPSVVHMVEISSDPAIGGKGLMEGKLSDGRLFVTFRGIPSGVSFSAVLERSNPDQETVMI